MNTNKSQLTNRNDDLGHIWPAEKNLALSDSQSFASLDEEVEDDEYSERPAVSKTDENLSIYLSLYIYVYIKNDLILADHRRNVQLISEAINIDKDKQWKT